MLLAHEEFEEQRALIEFPVFLAVTEDRAEQPPGAGTAKEMLLVGGFVVAVAGRKHHSFDAEFHHLIEERPDAVGIGAVEERGVGRHAEAAFDGFADSFEGDIEPAFAANGKIVVFLLAVHVDAEGEIFARLEQVDLFLEQQGVGAEVDVLLALEPDRPRSGRSAGAAAARRREC